MEFKALPKPPSYPHAFSASPNAGWWKKSFDRTGAFVKGIPADAKVVFEGQIEKSGKIRRVIVVHDDANQHPLMLTAKSPMSGHEVAQIDKTTITPAATLPNLCSETRTRIARLLEQIRSERGTAQSPVRPVPAAYA